MHGDAASLDQATPPTLRLSGPCALQLCALQLLARPPRGMSRRHLTINSCRPQSIHTSKGGASQRASSEGGASQHASEADVSSGGLWMCGFCRRKLWEGRGVWTYWKKIAKYDGIEKKPVTFFFPRTQYARVYLILRQPRFQVTFDDDSSKNLKFTVWVALCRNCGKGADLLDEW